MAIVVNDLKIDKVFVEGVQMEKVYVNNVLVYDVNMNISDLGYYVNQTLCGNNSLLSLIE